jgi:parallel beta-helix repeat protein
MEREKKNGRRWIVLTIVISMLVLIPSVQAEAIIIDHNCTNLSQIPDEWIDTVQDNIKLHYAHTSHGGQLTTGLQRIENADSDYRQARGSKYLPTETGALCIFDGQENDTYITPEEYWDSPAGRNDTQDVIDHNPTINVSMWSWCCQLTSHSEEHVQQYLDAINAFETANPDVTCIYMTCNAQAIGGSGYNRYLRNEQIRSWVSDHPEANQVLFDFADLDSWWYNSTTGEWEHATYDYSGVDVPVEHTEFHGSEAGHTTYESCEQKGRAFWWMMARLAGWEGISEDDVIYVPDDYTNIQWAVDNASIGDIIIVRDGTYPENVNVNKRLTIRAENGSGNCIVKASNPGDHVFEVTGSYVNISEFSITNATDFQKAGIHIGEGVDHCNISDNHVSNNDFGILLNNASNNTLQKNNASNNNCGILLDNASSNTITNNIANMNELTNIAMHSSSSNNTLTNNTALYSVNGIYLLEDSSNNTLTNNTASEDEYGICLFYSSCNNNLTGNTANSNTGELGGIYLWDSNGNTLTSNNASNNSQYGIYLESSSSNTLSSNTVNSNSNYGIYLDDSNNNLIYNNYFNNTNNACDDGTTNVWNVTPILGTNIISGSWLGGNYWSDYAGADTDGDGLGDTLLPYNSSGNIQQGGDWHPLTEVATLLSDLEITGTWVCGPDNCTICYNVTNTGNGYVSAGHNTMLLVDNVEVAHDCVPGELAPGENYTGCFDNYRWTYTQPADTITVCADFDDTVSESNETNNCLSETWKCGDVNMDGTVTPADSGKIFNRYLDSNYQLGLPWAADVNGDGTITPADSGKIFNRYLDSSYDLDCVANKNRKMEISGKMPLITFFGNGQEEKDEKEWI